MTLNICLFICTLLIVIFLFSKSPRRDYHWLKYAIGVIMILGIILHWKVIYMIPAYMTPPSTCELEPYSVFVIALTSSAQMFLGSTRIFDNGFQDFLFTDEGAPYLAGLSFLYMASVFISLFAIFNFVFQRIISRWKLKFTFSPRLEDEIHIFFGETKYSRLLINEIPKDKTIIVVEYPANDDTDYDASVMTGIHKLLNRAEKKNKKASKTSQTNITRRLIRRGDRINPILYLKAKRKLSDIELSDKTIASILDLKGIDDYIFRNNTFLYFLSDNESENITSINNIRLRVDQICAGKEDNKKICHIFCHAKKEGYNLSREDDYRNHFDVKFIDSSYLAIRQIICEKPDSLPVNFVKIKKESWAPNSNEQLETSTEYSLGCVESAFNAAIFGFGELGHDAFDFLFEYGAFVNENHERSDFHVFAYDNSKDNDLAAFKNNYPGLKDNADEFVTINNDTDLTSDEFWASFKENRPQSLNYVFICTGDDERNCKVLVSLDKCFDSPVDASTMRIMVKHSAGERAPRPESLKNINACVHFFGGDEDIWKFHIISDSTFITDAKRYFSAYKMASERLNKDDAEKQWENREKEIYSPNSTSRKKRIRQRSQDFANCLHLSTKKHLIGEKFLSAGMASALATSIPSIYQQDQPCDVFKEPHCKNCPEPQDISERMLLYLAEGEHIRWVASHIVMGYACGKIDSDEEKTHTCIVKYEDVPDVKDEKTGKILNYGLVRHYDWIVIKTTLEMAASENK